MASSGKQRKVIRKRKKKELGKDRKKANIKNGTTPSSAELFGDNKK